MDDDSLPPLNIPGLPLRVASGAGSASGWQYTPELGEAIAGLYVDEDGGLWGCHYAAPDRCPPPAVVRAWCRQFPAFGVTMREAERLRAEKMMEQTIVLADSGSGSVPRIALQIATRQTMAEKLDASRYGRGATNAHLPALAKAGDQPVALELDDDTLAALAMAGQTATAGG